MTRSLLFSVALAFAGTQVQSQSVALDGANSVIESYDVTYEVTSTNSATISYKKVVTLLNRQHGHQNVLVEGFNDDAKLTTYRASATDALGREIFSAKKNDWQEQRYTSQSTFYEDSWYRGIEVPCTDYPCTLTFEVEKKVTDFGLMGFPNWAPQDREQAVRSATFTAIVPSDNALLYDANLLPEATVTELGKTRKYAWSVSNLVAQPNEPLAPPASATLPYLRIGLANFVVDGYRGSFTDWKSFGAFIGDIMEGRDQLPPQLAARIRELTAGATNEWEKIDILYRFMQQRMRYVSIQLGIGGWQPFSAEYVEQNRFGDCKALSNYMGAMLREVGIPSYRVLINWGEDAYYPVKESFATFAFNHMVLYIPSQQMYLECTSNDAPTGYLGEDKQDRNVLWVTPEGGRLARTPTLAPADNGHTRTTNLSLGTDGQVGYQMQATYYGASQERFRGIYAAFGSRSDQLKYLHSNNLLPDVTGSEYTFTVTADKPEVHLAYATQLKAHVRKLGTRTFFPVNPAPFDDVPGPEPDRQLPVVSHLSRFLVDTINISMGPELEVESGAFTDPIVYTHEAGEYRASIQPTASGLQWIRTLKLLPVELPREAFAGYRQFFVDVAKAERAQLVMVQKKTK